ncbi:MAG: sporulation protein YqfD [Oscillospiraceae bacterium]|nr:sporulation protein YqfD [Oscillospiraceae bacterium]
MAYISFSAEGDSLSVFRDALRKNRISCSLQQIRGGIFYARTAAGNRRRILSLAETHRVRLVILSEHGLRFRLMPYRFRFGVLCGLLLGLMFLYWCNATVRSIEITGNTTISDDEILTALASLGVERGTPVRSIPFTYVEQRMRLNVRDIEWISLRHEGGRLIVDLTEERKPPEIDRSHMPANIIAAVPAQITSVNVLGGHAVKQAGDTVKAGELLITGVQPDLRGTTRWYRAKGTVTGIYQEQFRCEQPFVAELPVRGNTVTKPLLEVFGKRFSLSLTSDAPESGDWIYEENRQPLKLFRFTLPLTLIDCHYTEPATALTVFSEEEARAVLEESAARFERNFHANDTVISRKAEFTRTDLGISLNINYVFEGSIGKTSEIFVKLS